MVAGEGFADRQRRPASANAGGRDGRGRNGSAAEELLPAVAQRLRAAQRPAGGLASRVRRLIGARGGRPASGRP